MNSPGEYEALGNLAEGEELGSNLLHVGHRNWESIQVGKVGVQVIEPSPHEGHGSESDIKDIGLPIAETIATTR